MDTPEIPQQQLPVQQIDPMKDQTDNYTQKNQTRPIGPRSDRHPSHGVKMPSQARIKMSMQESAKGQLQDLAQQIYKIDQDMETIDNHLSEMRASLETIVKHYPPFPAESAERINNLSRFSALRKMIDQLTFPRQNDDLEKDPMWGRQILGLEGAEIPEIGSNSSDDQILDALNKVKIAQSNHQRQRNDFIAEANQILDQIG